MYVIKLEKLRLQNFKCLEELCLDGLAPVTVCSQGKGSTTIRDGLCWLLYGKDAAGSTRGEVRPMDAEGCLKDPWALTQVTASFLCGEKGKKDPFRREFRRSLKLDPDGNQIFSYYVDGVSCRKTEFDNSVKEWMPEPLFYVLTDPLYFMERLNRQEKLALMIGRENPPCFFDFCRDYPFAESVRKILKEKPVYLYEKQLQEKRRELAKTVSDLPVRISELQSVMKDLGIRDFEGMEKRRKLLSVRRLALMKQGKPERAEAVSREIRDLDRKLGLKGFYEAWANRLLMLKKQQAETVRRTVDIRNRQTFLKTMCTYVFIRLMDTDQNVQISRNLKVRLSEVGENGGLRFHLSYRGIPWKSLSRNEQQVAGAEWIGILREMWDCACPVFLDGSDDHPVKPCLDGQIIDLRSLGRTHRIRVTE